MYTHTPQIDLVVVAKSIGHSNTKHGKFLCQCYSYSWRSNLSCITTAFKLQMCVKVCVLMCALKKSWGKSRMCAPVVGFWEKPRLGASKKPSTQTAQSCRKAHIFPFVVSSRRRHPHAHSSTGHHTQQARCVVHCGHSGRARLIMALVWIRTGNRISLDQDPVICQQLWQSMSELKTHQRKLHLR